MQHVTCGMHYTICNVQYAPCNEIHHKAPFSQLEAFVHDSVSGWVAKTSLLQNSLAKAKAEITAHTSSTVDTLIKHYDGYNSKRHQVTEASVRSRQINENKQDIKLEQHDRQLDYFEEPLELRRNAPSAVA